MKKIAIILFDDVEVLDFAGPFEVFSITGKRKIGEPYEVFTVAEKDTVAARNQLMVKPTYTFANCPTPNIFLIPGGGGYHADGKPFGSRKEMHNPVMLEWIKQQNANVELVLSVCTGALILAKAGLLHGLEATTHFLAVDSLREITPETKVSPEKRFVDNGKIVLSAGVSAGIDMSFHVVEKLQGKEVALESARYMQYDYWR
ncbi:MAG: DJ-1/PfpI family protein [Bacteroidota bacterium]|jgi:transcriptional regulator GlxA family with amidase domain|nr:DJ-1/PfpI family protein [Flammeovirgaceae bacterium]MCZ8069394.1 DJ-1/PfpI family protein [Cytophagales bacterium]